MEVADDSLLRVVVNGQERASEMQFICLQELCNTSMFLDYDLSVKEDGSICYVQYFTMGPSTFFH